MGFIPYHPIVNSALEWIVKNPVSLKETRQRAWYTVGPGLLTRICQMYGSKYFLIYPSYYFYHFIILVLNMMVIKVCLSRMGFNKTKFHRCKDTINLPDELNNPNDACSVLISSYNTSEKYMKECLDSIQAQKGLFSIEVVWINDGSNKENTKIIDNY